MFFNEKFGKFSFKTVIKNQFLDKHNDVMISLSDVTNVNRVNSRSNTWTPHTSLSEIN